MAETNTSTSTDTRTNPPNPQRGRWIGLVSIGIVAVLALAAILWFVRDDAPAEVSLETAVENLELTDGAEDGDGVTADSGDSGDTSAAIAETDISGTWVIDTETGEFDYETATGSFVGFRIEEELNSIGATTAVGRTGDITGSMTIEGTTVTETSLEIDMTTITTNSSMRDDNVQDALETGQFPTATFTLTEPIELGAAAASGEAVSTTATGDLTIHGVTQQVEFAMDAQLINDVVVATGSTEMTFSDFGVDVPQGGPVISVDDFGIVELQFLLRR